VIGAHLSGGICEMAVQVPSDTNERVVALARTTISRMRDELEQLHEALEDGAVSIVGDGAYLKLEDAAATLLSSIEMILRTNTV
jgi:hypothetical protein